MCVCVRPTIICEKILIGVLNYFTWLLNVIILQQQLCRFLVFLYSTTHFRFLFISLCVLLNILKAHFSATKITVYECIAPFKVGNIKLITFDYFLLLFLLLFLFLSFFLSYSSYFYFGSLLLLSFSFNIFNLNHSYSFLLLLFSRFHF